MNASAVKALKEAEVVGAKPQGEFVSNVVGRTVEAKGEGSGFKRKAPLIAILVLLVAIPALIFSTTVLYPFHLAANMVQKVMTMWATVKEKVINVIHELLGKGSVPAQLQESLEVSGIEVGAVTATGEFIKTNQVIAEGPEYVVAAADGAMFKVASGELSLRFMGEIYSADEFLTEVKTNYRLYNAVTDAIGGQSSIFYDRAGQEAFDEIGINRNPYDGFQATGNAETDQQKFEDMFAALIDYKPSTTIETDEGCRMETVTDERGQPVKDESGNVVTECVGVDDDEEETDGSSGQQSASGNTPEAYIQDVAGKVKGGSRTKATNNAAALLNAAVSSSEPVQASKAASGILIAVEQAKAGDNGPINEAANMMMRESESSYADPTTGAEAKATMSPAEATNMSAVTADGKFSVTTASRYSRDRIAQTVSGGNTDSRRAVKGTLVSQESKLSGFRSWIAGLFKGRVSATEGLSDLNSGASFSIDSALYQDASKTMTGEALGERIVEGSAYINATMSRKVGGAAASDAAAIAEYTRVTQDLIAFEAEADRTARSPFDATSPNTFLGSIVNSMFSTVLKSQSVAGGLKNVTGTAGSSLLATLGGNAYADGSEEEYATSYGNCATLPAISGEGDLYCNQNPTFDTSTYDMTLNELEAKLGGELSGGKIAEGSDFEKYLVFGTDRETTPGVKDASICEKLDASGNAWYTRALNFITGGRIASLANACTGENERIATGAEYANNATSDSKSKWRTKYVYYQGYMLETYALELVGYYEGGKNPTVAAKEAYYERNPLDQSYAGIIARRTGLSKDEVIAGIEGIVYLAYLDEYNPSERYAFMDLPEEPEFEPEMDEHKVVSDNKERDSRALAIA